MTLPFLDTNVLLRHLLQDDPEQSPLATAYLGRLERGEVRVRTSDVVVFETVFTLQRRQGQPRRAIRDELLPLLDLPGIVLPGKRRFRRVFDLYVRLDLAFADAYHAVQMERLGIDQVVTFDQEIDRVPGLRRVSP